MVGRLYDRGDSIRVWQLIYNGDNRTNITGMCEVKKYQPSNGSEGSYFIETYCMKCRHCDPDSDGKKQCQILMNTMVYNVTDEKYPSEWRYNKNDEPICTKHERWNWEELGDPDDPNNPNYRIPVGPNQLTIF